MSDSDSWPYGEELPVGLLEWVMKKGRRLVVVSNRLPVTVNTSGSEQADAEKITLEFNATGVAVVCIE